MKVSWDRYTRLMGESPKPNAANYREVGNIALIEYMAWASNNTLDELPDFLKPFAGKVPQAELDHADPTVEPKSFEILNRVKDNTLADLRRAAERERAMNAVLGDHAEALFSVHLIREESNNILFTLERIHQVRFQHMTDTPANRGIDILIGLDEVDWSAVHHAYGSATDIPDLLRALTSDDEAVHDHAYEVLNGNITHQGTIYSASIEAIPFLLQMIDAPKVDKTAPLDLLTYISFAGTNTPDLRQKTIEKLEVTFPIFLRNLPHSNTEVRRAIAEQLALYASKADILTPLLKERIENDPDPQVRANCLRSLSQIWVEGFNETLHKKLSEEHQIYIANIMQDESYPMALRFEAALILLEKSPNSWLEKAVPVLYAAMETDGKTIESLNGVWIGGILYDVIRALDHNPELALKWIVTQASHADSRVREHVASSFQQLLEKGISIEQMLPTLKTLMIDSVPDVRQQAIGFFYNTSHAKLIIEKLSDLADHDPSLTIRTVARNTLNFIR